PGNEVHMPESALYRIHNGKEMDNPTEWLNHWIDGRPVMIMIEPGMATAKSAAGVQNLLHAMKVRFGVRLQREMGKIKPEEEGLLFIHMMKQSMQPSQVVIPKNNGRTPRR